MGRAFSCALFWPDARATRVGDDSSNPGTDDSANDDSGKGDDSGTECTLAVVDTNPETGRRLVALQRSADGDLRRAGEVGHVRAHRCRRESGRVHPDVGEGGHRRLARRRPHGEHELHARGDRVRGHDVDRLHDERVRLAAHDRSVGARRPHVPLQPRDGRVLGAAGDRRARSALRLGAGAAGHHGRRCVDDRSARWAGRDQQRDVRPGQEHPDVRLRRRRLHAGAVLHGTGARDRDRGGRYLHAVRFLASKGRSRPTGGASAERSCR